MYHCFTFLEYNQEFIRHFINCFNWSILYLINHTIFLTFKEITLSIQVTAIYIFYFLALRFFNPFIESIIEFNYVINLYPCEHVNCSDYKYNVLLFLHIWKYMYHVVHPKNNFLCFQMKENRVATSWVMKVSWVMKAVELHDAGVWLYTRK